MVRPRVADGGDGLHIWKVAANVSNRQSRTADKGWYSSLKRTVCYEMLHRASKLDGFFLMREATGNGCIWFWMETSGGL
jgi:hypothetical protein